MGEVTKIQWCDSTVNPTTGCDGCELWPGSCYAGALHEGRLAKSLPKLYAADFNEVRLAPGRMAEAIKWKDLRGFERPDKPWIRPSTPRMIFIGDLGDVMSKGVPDEYIRDEIILPFKTEKGRRHIGLILTKQPQRLAKLADLFGKQNGLWPSNLWVGTSITSNASLSRLKALERFPSEVRFASIEPLVEELNDPEQVASSVDWLIVGGESNQGSHKARPFKAKWARDLIAAGRKLATPVFVKQVGSNSDIFGVKDHHGGNWNEWPADLRVREFPR